MVGTAMAQPDDTLIIADEPEHHRFVARSGDLEAELVYRASPAKLILVHTGVPEELEGRGLGGQLVRAALDRAVADGLTVVPWCPFARRWLERHPDEAGRVRIDWHNEP
jgi:uncharacterized protein